MSFDLFFYQRKNTPHKESSVISYLDAHISHVNIERTQWTYQNEVTRVYFYIAELEKEEIDGPGRYEFPDFEPVGFDFSVNFMRPEFFGRESFMFLEKMLNELDLYVLNPQSETDIEPYKPSMEALYENWAITNREASIRNFDVNTCYLSPEKSDEIWRYNYQRDALQEEIGEDQFVSKIFLYKRNDNAEIVTLFTWSDSIPNVFPPAEYVIIYKTYKTLLGKKKTKRGIISYDTFLKVFGDYLEDFRYPGCKSISPENAEKASRAFKKLRFEYEVADFGKVAKIESVYNYR